MVNYGYISKVAKGPFVAHWAKGVFNKLFKNSYHP